MKVLILGDPFQNESVNKVSNNVELMKPYTNVYVHHYGIQ